jgi:D-3-phosphoglycerate dehydrogenase
LAEHDLWFGPTDRAISTADLIERAKTAEILLVGRERIDSPLLDKLPNLQAIAKYGVGLDNVDIRELQRRGIALLHAPGVNRFAVAELTIGLAISVFRNIAYSDRSMRAGIWRKDGGRQLFGATVAIIGCGAVGSELARALKAFQCRLLLNDIRDISPLANEVNGIIVDYVGALSQADMVSFHVPLTAETDKMFGFRELSLVRRGCIVVNTSRGEVIDESALAAGLESGQLGGAACDVFVTEPQINHNLLKFDNFVGTAHIAGNSLEAVWAMGNAALQGIENYLGKR